MNQDLSTMRLDKWLWTARFFKTRQLAAEAINGGKVHIDGQRTKPGKDVRPGVRLRIHKASLEWEVEVMGLAKQRRPASEAAQLYQESEASKREREHILEERRILRASDPRPSQRPSKRDRRQISRFTQKSE